MLWLISISFVNLATIADEPSPAPPVLSRADIVSDVYGGEITEDFDDEDGLEEIINARVQSSMVQPMDEVPFEDFESYNDNEELIGLNGWTRHDTHNMGQFTAQKDSSMTPTGGTIGVQYCGSTTTASYILSENFSMTKGYISIKMGTNYVAPQTQETTLIYLYASTSNNPEASDIITRIGFIDNALSVYDTKWNQLLYGYTNTWYTVNIEFDCSKNEFKLSTTSQYGASSDVTTYKFSNNHDTFNRIGLIAGKRVGYTYITSYFDDLRVFEKYNDSYAITKPIVLPSNMQWSSVIFKDPSYTCHGITISIMKTDRSPIDGFPTYQGVTLIDLSPLNEKKVDTFIMNISVKRRIGLVPMLNAFIIDYHSSSGWRDSFNTHLYTSDMKSTDTLQGTIRLQSGQQMGYFVSKNISLASNNYWENLYFQAEGSSTNMLEVQILNAETGKVITSYKMNEGPTVNIRSIDPFLNSIIQIRVFFYRINGNSATLQTLAASWRQNINPTIGEVIIPDRVLRTDRITITAVIVDADQPTKDLEVEFMYLSPDKFTVSDEYFENIMLVENENRYYIDFRPTAESLLGNYSIIIKVTDIFGVITHRTIADAIIVENNAPTDPRISLTPMPAYTDSTIRSALLVPSTDRDLETIYYTYRVFINEEERSEFNKVRVSDLDNVIIPPSATKKQDVIRVEVNSTDGLNHTAVHSAEVIIKNSPPTLTTKENIYAIIDEDHVDDEQIDLSELIRDKDDDELQFTFDIYEDIDLEVDPSTLRLIIMPRENYTGTKTVPVTVTDGQSELRFNITIYVNPVNDPPIGSILSPPSVAKFLRGDEIWLKAEASDSDNRPLEIAYSWKLDGKEIGTTKEMKYRIDEPGEYLITCTVNDGEFLVQIGEISLTIEKPEPPYSIEEIHTLYEKNTPPVRMEIRNADGLPSQADNTDIPEINITKLECTADDEFAFITMTLGSNPVPEGYGWDQSGAKGMYRVFFVKNSFREQDYDQSKLSIDNIDMMRPSRGLTYLLAEESYLSLGERNSYGSPTVNGSQIEWTIPMTDLEQAGVSMPLRMYATTSYMSTEDGMIIAGFDTIGYEAQTHPTDLMIKEVSSDTGKVGIGLLVIFIIIFLLIGLAIGAAVMFFVRGKMEKPPEEKVSEGEGPDENIPSQSINAPVSAGQLPNRISVMPPPATQAPTQPSPPATTVAQDPKQ